MKFTILNKTVNIFKGVNSHSPVVYLNTFDGQGEMLFNYAKENLYPDFSLVSIEGLDWNSDLSPWEAESVFNGEEPFRGNADSFIGLLEDEIAPKAERDSGISPKYRCISGYSLAGLFAVYTMYKTALFSHIESSSGSLWFPSFIEYALSHDMKRVPERVYLSLGDKEKCTSNKALRSVEEDTNRLYMHLKKLSIKSTFVLNRGNHFQDPLERTAWGIKWLLEE